MSTRDEALANAGAPTQGQSMDVVKREWLTEPLVLVHRATVVAAFQGQSTGYGAMVFLSDGRVFRLEMDLDRDPAYHWQELPPIPLGDPVASSAPAR
jgi:hypothetical protein